MEYRCPLSGGASPLSQTTGPTVLWTEAGQRLRDVNYALCAQPVMVVLAQEVGAATISFVVGSGRGRVSGSQMPEKSSPKKVHQDPCVPP